MLTLALSTSIWAAILVIAALTFVITGVLVYMRGKKREAAQTGGDQSPPDSDG